jgi:Holliday junction DNA helicase RuvB
MDNRILETIVYKFNCRPVGLKNIAVSVGEDEGTIEEVYEPFLIQEGFLLRTPKGRMVTNKTLRRFGIKAPNENPRQGSLF